jgi:hypothetical protein
MDGSQRSPVEKHNMNTATVITKVLRTDGSEPFIFCVVYTRNTVISKTHNIAVFNFTIGTLKIQHVSVP